MPVVVIGFFKYKKTENIRLLSVTAAFGVFFLNNLISSISLYFNIITHGDLELFGAICDLIALVLLLLPVIKKQNSS